MKWSQLRTFIAGRDPFFFQNADSGSPEKITALERALEIILPQCYKDFLADISSHATFDPFGMGRGSKFDFRNVSIVPRQHYPIHEMFRISISDHNQLDSPNDLFLDLKNFTDDDACLIEYSPHGIFDPSRMVPHPLSFLELVTSRAFHHFMPETNLRLVSKNMEEIAQGLNQFGFTDALPHQKRIRVLERLGRLVLLEDSETEEEFRAVIVHGLAGTLEELHTFFQDFE